jgi:ketosteroid isomerase-like protein
MSVAKVTCRPWLACTESAMPSPTQVIESVLTAFTRGDIPSILDQIAADAAWGTTLAPDVPYHGTYHGRDGAARFFERIGGAPRVTASAPTKYVASGDDVVALGSWSGTAISTGKAFTSAWALTFTVSGGKIVAFQGYEDTALTAAAFRT